MAEQATLFGGAASAFGLVGDSPEIQRVLRFIHKTSNNRWPVLLLGESGTGKELVARAVHSVSPGSNGVFVAVNSAALPPELMDSELFGHARGSFTGATAAKRGLIAQADGGTLFLDEIGELPLDKQAKLLRVIEESEVRPVGGDALVKVDIRLIAATNRDLAADAAHGRFRTDLYFRLNVLTLRLAPLRDRREDIAALALHFLARHGHRPMTIDTEVLRVFHIYDWPGNVRELENTIQWMIAQASGDELGAAHLPTPIRNAAELGGGVPARQVVAAPQVRPIAEIEKLEIEHALKATRGDMRAAARLLGISKSTIYRKRKEYGLESKSTAAAT